MRTEGSIKDLYEMLKSNDKQNDFIKGEINMIEIILEIPMSNSFIHKGIKYE